MTVYDGLTGILALQGDFARHGELLESLGAPWLEVRTIDQLEAINRLIIPGGESTTLLKFFESWPWLEALRVFAAQKPLFGTCAGAILMAERVDNPPQQSLGVIPMTVRRNAYGRQVDSFIADLTDHALGGGGLPAIFIRAPKITGIAADVEVLARHGEDPVLVRYGRHYAATFHPELTDDPRVHARFLEE